MILMIIKLEKISKAKSNTANIVSDHTIVQTNWTWSNETISMLLAKAIFNLTAYENDLHNFKSNFVKHESEIENIDITMNTFKYFRLEVIKL